MTASCTILRLITLLFLLAAVLLLRKPVFGQDAITSPQIRVPHPIAVRLRRKAGQRNAPKGRLIESVTVSCTSN